MDKSVDSKNKEKTKKPPSRFAKGTSGNPNGRPKGRRNASTVIWDALQNIAKAQNKTPEELETMLQQVGLQHAYKGNHQFYESISNRLYGKVKDRSEVDMNVTETASPEVKKLTQMLNDIHRRNG